MTPEDFLALKRKADRLRREADRLAGERRQLLKRLKDEFGVGSLEEGKALLKRLEAEERACEKKFRAELDTFEKAHGRALANGSGG